MQGHQRGELNSPNVWSRIKSAFSGSRSDKDVRATINHLVTAVLSHDERIEKMSVDLSRMIVEVAELRGSASRAIELVLKLKDIVAADSDAQAKVDAITAELDDMQKALEAAADQGGSMGGVV